MTPLAPLGHVLARACLAGTCLTLLAMPDLSEHRSHSKASAPVTTEPAGGAALCVAQPQADSRPDCTRPPCDARRIVHVPAGVRPIGLSSDGEPHDSCRQSAAALPLQTRR